MIDMERVQELLNQARVEAEWLHNRSFSDRDDFDGGPKEGRAERAELSRQLLRLADLCEEISAEVRRQYWRGKGYPS